MAVVGQRLAELAAGGDIELGEDLGLVVLHGARGQEQPGGDLRVGQARPDQAGDLDLLGARLSGDQPAGRPGRNPLPGSQPGERQVE